MNKTNIAMDAAPAGESKNRSFKEQLLDRQSKELILAFSGAIGAGIGDVRPLFEEALVQAGYKVVVIKVSNIIKDNIQRLLNKKNINKDYSDLAGHANTQRIERYSRLQDAGNDLRGAYSNEILAQLIINGIATHETRQKAEKNHSDDPPERVAFIVDQLKHYDEVRFLREIYGNNFYLIGILSGHNRRLERISRETRAESSKISGLIERDRKENFTHGQQLEKTLKLSDLFIRNSSGNRPAMEAQIKRFIKLVHNAVDVTPTKEEFGMYVAHSSGLASACMSRQVGAAILSDDGTVVSTGCNDVPRAGGGLYSDITKPDFRCVMKTEGICHNDAEKDEIREEIKNLLTDQIKMLSDKRSKESLSKELSDALANSAIAAKLVDRLADTIRTQSRLGDLIEFSRAVHAEMDAITSVARRGGGGVMGGTLFTTTYPCHNCARHILAAGISKVYFIEPYEKSLAIKLHSDAIVHDIELEEAPPQKIPFLHFEGVAPRRYQDLFSFSQGRKQNGLRISFDVVKAGKKMPQMLDGYRTIEIKVLEELEKQGVIDAPEMAR